MGSVQNNTVHYCCVSRGGRILYVYSGGDHEIENLAAMCLERTPPYHRWYFETIGKKTFGFLVEDGFVYFTIVDEGFGNAGVLRFLEHLRDEFKKVARKGSRGSFSGMNTINVQEQGVNDLNAETSSSDNMGLSPSPCNSNVRTEVASSTKAPLLGKSNKQDKKKSKDHIITMRDAELDEHRKSTERGVKFDPATLDSNNQEDMGSMRIRSSSQSLRKKWCRQVRIVLAIDAAVCLILFVIWLSICGGFGCIR
ncbi:hypothetical protein Tsubulata_001431 [Turnera subulata]|uniref:Longin domain-containing protein n=1 Tax=Turnera subulata TaxID=218843 RepID=A0A9Q0J5S7_9ROSI|nr:hypothetical protein Tsubulata_001431 [Turnera subulata]